MVQEKGTISIHTENIFPIIKKFLYSDNEIFLRELVSNAVDATQKVKRLSSLGQYNQELGDLTIQVAVDEKAKTIRISDKGIGMTADEIKKYINQIAFSGAEEFLEKFKEAKDANEIIGRFGLGFYSAFMVAEKVEIETLSYEDGAEPARWICDGSTEFEMVRSMLPSFLAAYSCKCSRTMVQSSGFGWPSRRKRAAKSGLTFLCRFARTLANGS